MPGLGTLLAGWTETGTEQLALFAIGVLLLITDRQTSLLGIIAVLSAWLWALLLSRANLHRNGWKHKPKPAMQPWLLVLFVLATLAAVVLMLYRLGLLFLP
jgi:hypothetical protein